MKKILVMAAAFCLTLISAASSHAQNIPQEGDMFVDFTVQQDPSNPSSTVSLSNYVGKGKWVIVDFWASWCGPCRREIPYIRKAWQNLPKDKVTVLSVAVADKLEDTKKAAVELNIQWNQIVNAGQVPVKAYGIRGIPHIILFAPDGKIAKIGLRGDDIYNYTLSCLEGK